VACMGGEERCLQRFWWGNLKGDDHLEDLRVDGKAILTRIFKKLAGSGLTRLVWLKAVTSGGLW
jgi:hypothetical protein